MKTMNLDEVNQYVREVLAEVKKKKQKADEIKKDVHSGAYSYSEAFDFSVPLGGYNLYKTQGAVNWGPQTGPGQSFEEKVAPQAAAHEVLRQYLKGVVKESVDSDISSWEFLAEALTPPVPEKREGVWGEALDIVEKKYKLANKKAAIGKKK